MSQPMTPPPPVQEKKRSPMFWVAIGCLVIVLLGLVAMAGMCVVGGRWVQKQAAKFEENPAIAAAELAVRANPELELVESDPKAGTITVRNKKTGEVVTWNAEDIESGKWSVSTEEGTTTVGGAGPENLPAWVPAYPGGSVAGTFDTTSPEGRTVAFTVTTSDSVATVLEFYEDRLEAAGLTVQKSTFEAAGAASGGTVSGTSQDDKRAVSVMVSTGEGQTTAVVSVTEKP